MGVLAAQLPDALQLLVVSWPKEQESEPQALPADAYSQAPRLLHEVAPQVGSLVLQAALQHRPTPLTPQTWVMHCAFELQAAPGASVPPVVVPVVVPEVELPVEPPVVVLPPVVVPVVPPVLVVVVELEPHAVTTMKPALINASREPRM
jgi:hypothetical protein